MAGDELFNDPHAVFKQNAKKPVRTSVIKNDNVKIGERKKIEQSPDAGPYGGKVDIRPIIENNQVVGIIHTCSCGKVSEIRFDFDD